MAGGVALPCVNTEGERIFPHTLFKVLQKAMGVDNVEIMGR